MFSDPALGMCPKETVEQQPRSSGSIYVLIKGPVSHTSSVWGRYLNPPVTHTYLCSLSYRGQLYTAERVGKNWGGVTHRSIECLMPG